MMERLDHHDPSACLPENGLPETGLPVRDWQWRGPAGNDFGVSTQARTQSVTKPDYGLIGMSPGPIDGSNTTEKKDG